MELVPRSLVIPGRRPTAVALAPDLGERYLDTVYDEDWVSERYDDALARRPDRQSCSA